MTLNLSSFRQLQMCLQIALGSGPIDNPGVYSDPIHCVVFMLRLQVETKKARLENDTGRRNCGSTKPATPEMQLTKKRNKDL